jgi:hypothetical protein
VSAELPLPTQDPFGRGPLVVTRLESPTTGTVIEGRFGLGWIGRLTREQLDLVGLLLVRRNNLQQLATDLGVSYNTIRARFYDLVDALGADAPATAPRAAAGPDVKDVLRRLAAGELSTDEASAELRTRPR